ncbi:MAG: Trm112 family protein [Propionibacteriaceae bacterium]|nr:Trm112 family protein [Propionibacteriaceae bacterium]
MNSQFSIDAELLELLVCPDCRSRLALAYESAELMCTNGTCALIYPVLNGVPVLLTDEARKA